MCMTPWTRKDELTGKYDIFPCGKCPECIARRVSAWSFRLLREGLYADSSFFITLTYDTDHVPITNGGYMGLSVPFTYKVGGKVKSVGSDLQSFFKRLRKLHNSSIGQPIKYYAVGEYGSDNYRPHYHIIAFNIQLDLIMSATDLNILRYTNFDGKTHIKISPWTLNNESIGTCTFGKVSGASIGYCMKYLSKPSRIPIHQNDDRPREFALMSKRLGSGYLTPAIIDWHRADLENRMYLNIEGGKKISMPRYYKDKIYTDEQRLIIADSFKAIHKKEQDEYFANFDPILDYNTALAVEQAFKRMHLKHKLC